MLDTPESNVKEKVEKRKTNVKKNFEKVTVTGIESVPDPLTEQEMVMAKIREELLLKFKEYRTTMNYMAADAPIEVLCLPKEIERILITNDILRIYDVFDVDFTKIKGLGVVRIRYLTACLDQFFSML